MRHITFAAIAVLLSFAASAQAQTVPSSPAFTAGHVGLAFSGSFGSFSEGSSSHTESHGYLSVSVMPGFR